MKDKQQLLSNEFVEFVRQNYIQFWLNSIILNILLEGLKEKELGARK